MNILNFLFSGLTSGAVYALIGLGFVTIYRASGVVNFAQGDLVVLGGVITINLIGIVPYPVAALIAIAITVVVGILIHELVIARLRQLTMATIIMSTLGVSMFLQGGSLVTMGGWQKALPPFTGIEPVKVFSASFSRQGLWVILITIVILVILYFINNRTLLGKKMTAAATQPLAAGFVGIARGAMVRWAFIISATVGALSGISLATIVPINYASGSAFMLKGFVGAVLGGWGKTTGAVVGGFVLGIIEAFSAAIMPSGYKDAVAFVILLIVLYFKPSGLLGSSLVEAE